MKKRSAKHDAENRDAATSAADAELQDFARAMADVVRLPSDPRGRVRAVPPIRRPSQVPSATVATEFPEDEPAETSYVAPGVDTRELRKLKRGAHPATSRLDLHGQTAAEAISSVRHFIEKSLPRHRSVCIVHGRGLHSEANIAVLKTRVRQYLRQHRGVLAYTDAPRGDGGPGAVYVLLRK